MLYLGIDAGTSGLKTLLLDAEGRTVGQGLATYSLQTPRPGWVESDPEQWWQALCTATRQALAASGRPASAVAAVGFSGQMHTLVLLDAAGRPLRPAIGWADRRSSAERDWIEQRVGRERLIALTGSPALAALTATKLLWVRHHEPAVWAQVQSAVLPKDYLRLRLTGVLASDPSDGGATGLLDLRTRAWSPELLAALDLPTTLLPPLSPSTALVGQVTRSAADEVGLAAGTPVACGAGDTECAALGCGVTAPGPLLITVGTAAQIFAATDSPLYDPLGRVHGWPHALIDRWHLLAAIPAAGLALSWLRGVVAGTATDSPIGARPPLFLPALAGERTPSMNEEARAIFLGLDLTHRAADLLFAAREGVAFALRYGADVLADLGVADETTIITGGLSADGAFVSLLADVLDRPLSRSAQREGSGYGAALLAALALGVALGSSTPPLQEPPIQPNPARAAWHAERYTVYRRLSAVAAQLSSPDTVAAAT